MAPTLFEDLSLPADERGIEELLPDGLVNNLGGPAPLSPGDTLAAQGLVAHHPVVIIPGIVSTGLEMWKGKNCAPRFRERIWGETVMLRKMLLHPSCWLEHLSLNATTGMDPDGIKVRAASGYQAADYILGGYSLWGPLIDNLAKLGYDENSMRMAPYDWRLGFMNLERRDHFFKRLRNTIELLSDINDGRPAAVIGHSMGANVMLFFLSWIRSEAVLGAVAGDAWVDRHIAAFVNVAGPVLGTAKAMASVVSGEMKDTAELGQAMNLVKDRWVSREQLVKLFRTFGSMPALMPVGGDAVWGNGSWSPEVPLHPVSPKANGEAQDPHRVLGPMITNRAPAEAAVAATTAATSADGPTETPAEGTADASAPVGGSSTEHLISAHDIIHKHLPALAPEYAARVLADYNFAHAFGSRSKTHAPGPSGNWNNPLLTPLPAAPNLRIYCLYGVGKPTERAYHFVTPSEDNPGTGVEGATRAEVLLTPSSVIDTSVNDPPQGLAAGVQLGDGDGTVPLVSLGYMCVRGWNHPRRNPAGVRVTTREYAHKAGKSDAHAAGAASASSIRAALGHDAAPASTSSESEGESEGDGLAASSFDMSGVGRLAQAAGLANLRETIGTSATGVAATLLREGVLRGGLNILREAGGATADHVDILLNKALMTDILHIAAGDGESVPQVIKSDIMGIADRIDGYSAENGVEPAE